MSSASSLTDAFSRRQQSVEMDESKVREFTTAASPGACLGPGVAKAERTSVATSLSCSRKVKLGWRRGGGGRGESGRGTIVLFVGRVHWWEEEVGPSDALIMRQTKIKVTVGQLSLEVRDISQRPWSGTREKKVFWSSARENRFDIGDATRIRHSEKNAIDGLPVVLPISRGPSGHALVISERGQVYWHYKRCTVLLVRWALLGV